MDYSPIFHNVGYNPISVRPNSNGARTCAGTAGGDIIMSNAIAPAVTPIATVDSQGRNYHALSINQQSQAGDILPLSAYSGIGNVRPASVNTLGNDAPIDIHVPQSVKEKIWNGQYVDMASLYRDNATRILASADSGSELTMAVERGRIVFRPATPHPRKLDSIDKWSSAFHVFMAIYTTRHQGRFLELLKYAETVRTASVQFPGLGWRNYDEQFRLRMEANPSRSWASMDMELWVTVAAAGSMLPAANAHTNPSRNQYSLGSNPVRNACFAFNSVAGCRWNSCRYVHSCSRCARSGHGASSCRVAGGAPAHGNPAKQSATPASATYTRYSKTPSAAVGVQQAFRPNVVSSGAKISTGAGSGNQQWNKGNTTTFRPPNTH